jgi:TorA maturation chaperone TorD
MEGSSQESDVGVLSMLCNEESLQALPEEQKNLLAEHLRPCLAEIVHNAIEKGSNQFSSHVMANPSDICFDFAF